MFTTEYRYTLGLRINRPGTNQAEKIWSKPVKLTDREEVMNEARRMFKEALESAPSGSRVIATLYDDRTRLSIGQFDVTKD